MLFEQRFVPGMVDGSITLTFRRWKRRQVVAGRRYRYIGGFIRVESIDEVDPFEIGDDDAHRSGYPDADALRADLRGDAAAPVYRIAFRHDPGADPRAELAATDALDPDAIAAITARLDRLDRASSHGAWTRPTLALIAEHPGTRAGDLAALAGRERDPFKVDVRKLKNLGLTISLEVGYELSPRGQAYLDRTT